MNFSFKMPLFKFMPIRRTPVVVPENIHTNPSQGLVSQSPKIEKESLRPVRIQNIHTVPILQVIFCNSEGMEGGGGFLIS